MQIKEYGERVFSIIESSSYIESRDISFEEYPPDAAYITGMITFINGSKLHFKEFIFSGSKEIYFLKYAYNYLAQNNTLVFRYDNAFDPRAKKLLTYPEHKHLPDSLLPVKKPS